MLCRDQVGDDQLSIRYRVGRKRRGVPLRDLCAEALGSLTDGQGKGFLLLNLSYVVHGVSAPTRPWKPLQRGFRRQGDGPASADPGLPLVGFLERRLSHRQLFFDLLQADPIYHGQFAISSCGQKGNRHLSQRSQCPFWSGWTVSNDAKMPDVLNQF